MAKAAKAKRKRPAPARARRYSIHARVRYRVNDGGWRDGRTENISKSGVLLHTEELLPPNTPIDLVVELPPVFPGEAAPQVVCRGRVVRTVAEEMNGAVVAAKFTQCTFGRSDDAEATAPYET
jgi:hypothetical protein